MRSSPRPAPKLVGSALIAAVAVGIGTGVFFLVTMSRSLAEPDLTAYVEVSSSPPRDFIAEAEQAMDDGAWPQAAAAYRGALLADPTAAAAAAGLARALTFQYEFADAREFAQKAVELDPLESAYHAVRAQTLNWSGDLAGAAIAARRAIELNPSMADAYAFLAETYTDRYQLPEAEREIERALGLEPNGVEPLRVRAYLLETRGRYGDAIAAYQQAIDAAPRYAHLHLALGHVYRATGQFEAALASFALAVALAPQDARPPTGTGMVHAALDDLDTAITYFEQGTRLDATYATAAGQLGTSLYRKRDYARAQEPLERAVQLEKSSARLSSYLHALGWTYLQNQALDPARDTFQRALQLDPQLEGARLGLQAVANARVPSR